VHSRVWREHSSVGEAFTLKRESFTLKRRTLELRGCKCEGGHTIGVLHEEGAHLRRGAHHHLVGGRLS
jgi:hypothetical protein